MGYSSKILNNSLGSLLAQQAVIATTSNNIANANTPGYVRRTIDLETRSTSSTSQLDVGNGVKIGRVTRVVDSFVDKVLRQSTSEKGRYDVEAGLLDRVQRLFSLDNEGTTIGSAITEFRTALDDLSANPASIALRTNVIQRGQDLVNSIKTSYNAIADLQMEANDRITQEVATVNELTAQIAKLNGEVRTREAAGGIATDQRDTRDQLLQKLSQKISFTMVETDDGEANVYLEKGFSLVSGSDSRALETIQIPTIGGLGVSTASLNGSQLHYIVYDYDSTGGASHIDLTRALAVGGGTVGGLLKVRGYAPSGNSPDPFASTGYLVQAASGIEAITRSLMFDVNTVYQGTADEDSVSAGYQSNAVDYNSQPPATYGLFDLTAGGSDLDSNGRPDDAAALVSAGRSLTKDLVFVPPTAESIAAGLDTDVGNGSRAVARGDARNLVLLTTQLRATNVGFSVPSFNFTGSYDAAYNKIMSDIGSSKTRADSNLKVADSTFQATLAHKESISGVSLDEEFTNLIRFQKAFQASARMIKVADGLLDEIVRLI